jgi:hypothetical protein
MNQRDLLTQHEQEERRVSDCCIGSYNDFQTILIYFGTFYYV